MKKIPKYIVYAGIAAAILLLVYALFQSTRETFTSVNPLPTQADYAALKPAFEKANKEFEGKPQSEGKRAAAALKLLPESFKAMSRFSRANIIPLLPYRFVKMSTYPDGSDNYDFMMIFFVEIYKDLLVLPLAYAVKQQSSPPTLSAFIDMVVKIVKDNAPGNQPLQINAEQQGLIDQAKKGETTMQMPNGDTYPNPGYWAYKYIYGDAKTLAKSGPASATSSAGGGISAGAGGGGGKCAPSVTPVPGGVSEIRCFN